MHTLWVLSILLYLTLNNTQLCATGFTKEIEKKITSCFKENKLRIGRKEGIWELYILHIV